MKRKRTKTGDRTFLADVLTAQYCLFLAFRIRDDLMDDGRTPRILRRAVDRLILDAGKIFSKHFPPGAAFWRVYGKCLAGTTSATVEVDDLQRSTETSLPALRKAYARVNSVFRVGSAAVCRRHSRLADYPMVRSFSDRFSAGCQILDDLADIAEDLGRGRWNYAANFIMRGSRAAAQGGRVDLKRVTGSLLSGGAGIALLGEAGRLIGNAFSAIEPLGLPHAAPCRRTYEESIDAMKLELFTAGIAVRRGHAPIGRAGMKGSRV
ncbi:MAG TPA: hypothetical protein VI932_06930 [Bacteroidota bacterium]|nr:hypothetical protein [Bacteroidota bacterium]